MAKTTGLFRIIAGVGAAAAAVVLSRKESRDKLKEQYNNCLLYTSDAADE